MAQPIPLQMPPRDPRQELMCRLENAPAEHAEALLAAYDLLQELHDKGVLETARGALSAGDKIVNEAVKVANTPDSIRAMRNLIILFQSAGAIDPEILKAIVGALPGALSAANEPEPPGLWTLIKKFRTKNVRRVLSMTGSFLEGFGRNLSSAKQSKEERHEQT
jgi:uncharacterized protein YjgD (DUF1641 family)